MVLLRSLNGTVLDLVLKKYTQSNTGNDAFPYSSQLHEDF